MQQANVAAPNRNLLFIRNSKVNAHFRLMAPRTSLSSEAVSSDLFEIQKPPFLQWWSAQPGCSESLALLLRFLRCVKVTKELSTLFLVDAEFAQISDSLGGVRGVFSKSVIIFSMSALDSGSTAAPMPGMATMLFDERVFLRNGPVYDGLGEMLFSGGSLSISASIMPDSWHRFMMSFDHPITLRTRLSASSVDIQRSPPPVICTSFPFCQDVDFANFSGGNPTNQFTSSQSFGPRFFSQSTMRSCKLPRCSSWLWRGPEPFAVGWMRIENFTATNRCLNA